MQRACKELLICAKLAVFQQPGTTASNFLQLKIVMYVEERRCAHDLLSLRWPYKPPNARNDAQHQHANKSKVCRWSLTYCEHCSSPAHIVTQLGSIVSESTRLHCSWRICWWVHGWKPWHWGVVTWEHWVVVVSCNIKKGSMVPTFSSISIASLFGSQAKKFTLPPIFLLTLNCADCPSSLYA